MAIETVFVDSLQAVAVHNGVMRITLVRLDPTGKPLPALELLIPVSEGKSLVAGLQKVVGGKPSA